MSAHRLPFDCSRAYSAFLISALVFTVALLTASCGSGSPTTQPQPPQFSGNTSVTIVLSSAANAQITDFQVGLQSLTLTNQAGKSVTLLSSPKVPSSSM